MPLCAIYLPGQIVHTTPRVLRRLGEPLVLFRHPKILDFLAEQICVSAIGSLERDSTVLDRQAALGWLLCFHSEGSEVSKTGFACL